MQHFGAPDAGAQAEAPAEDLPSPPPVAPPVVPTVASPGPDQAPLPAGADEQLRSRAGQDTAERASDPPSRPLAPRVLAPKALALRTGKPDAPSSPTEAVQATGDQGTDGVLGHTKWSGTGPISFSFPADPGIYGPDSVEARSNFAQTKG